MVSSEAVRSPILLPKYDSVNERTCEISGSVKLHIQGVWQNGHEINKATG